jgi:hypothetical protein
VRDGVLLKINRKQAGMELLEDCINSKERIKNWTQECKERSTPESNCSI